MPHLTRGALLAFEKLAVDDDAAYARADGDVDQVPKPPTRAVVELPERGHVRVVAQKDGEAGSFVHDPCSGTSCQSGKAGGLYTISVFALSGPGEAILTAAPAGHENSGPPPFR